MKKFSVYILTLMITTSALAGTGDEEKNKTTEPTQRLQPMKIRNRAARPDIPGTFVIEIGWNILQDVPDNMEIGNFGSRTLNMYYYYDIPVGNSNFVIMPGIGFGLDRYKFDNDITLQQSIDSDGNTVVSSVDVNDEFDVKKSQLITNYFDIPLEVRFYANPDDKKRSFNVGVGGKVGMRFGAKTKLKYKYEGENTKIKNKQEFGLNRFRYGVTGRMGIGGFNVFYYQSLSELFDKGPTGTADAANITVGLSFTGF